MLTHYEREQCRDQELYDYTKSITKIEGYQVTKWTAEWQICNNVFFSGLNKQTSKVSEPKIHAGH